MQSIIDKPIIFWDTCALLDLLRISRESSTILSTYKNILAIIEKIESGEILSVLVKELIDIEIANNKNNIIREYQTDLRKLNDSIKQHQQLEQEIFPVPIINIISLQDIHVKFEDIINNIIIKSQHILRNSAINQRAERRVIEYKHPSSKKGEIKDSWMIESCIEMRRHQVSSLKPCIFISSNTSDFCDNSNDKLFHLDIKSDTDSLNIVYRKNISELYGYLRSESII